MPARRFGVRRPGGRPVRRRRPGTTNGYYHRRRGGRRGRGRTGGIGAILGAVAPMLIGNAGNTINRTVGDLKGIWGKKK